MEKQQYSLAGALEGFGKCYDVAHSIWVERVGLPSEHKELLQSAVNSLLYFTRYAHERAGRNPSFPLYHRIAIVKAYKEEGDVISPTFANRVWERFEKLTPYDAKKGRYKTNEKLTKEPVCKVLEKLREGGEANLIKYLRGRSLKEAHKWLCGFRGIGNKVASLLLRDIWCYIGEWPDTPTSDHKFLQPIDVWVRLLSREAFPMSNWPLGDLAFAEQLVNHCKSTGIDPIEFNKGTWFVGSHFYRLCHFFKIAEEERFDYERNQVDYGVAKDFDATAVLEGITDFRGLEAKGIFWV
ncbi:hypothetical protein ES703_04239 [subsurface metagenome]